MNPFQSFVVRFGAGQKIFSEGDLGTTMYIIQAGKVRLFRIIDGQKRVHGTMEKGEFFGEMSILEGMPRTVSAEAADDAELIEINSMTFEKMIRGNIEIAVRMLRKLSNRLREAERRLDQLQLTETRAGHAVRPAPAVVPKPTAAVTGPRLDVDGEGTVFPLLAGETLIGRYDPMSDQRPDIDLTPVDLKRSVSRRHARIVATPDGYVITEEIGALNGTSVNGTKLVTDCPQPIADGDRISVGQVKLVFRA